MSVERVTLSWWAMAMAIRGPDLFPPCRSWSLPRVLDSWAAEGSKLEGKGRLSPFEDLPPPSDRSVRGGAHGSLSPMEGKVWSPFPGHVSPSETATGGGGEKVLWGESCICFSAP